MAKLVQCVKSVAVGVNQYLKRGYRNVSFVCVVECFVVAVDIARGWLKMVMVQKMCTQLSRGIGGYGKRLVAN